VSHLKKSARNLKINKLKASCLAISYLLIFFIRIKTDLLCAIFVLATYIFVQKMRSVGKNLCARKFNYRLPQFEPPSLRKMCMRETEK